MFQSTCPPSPLLLAEQLPHSLHDTVLLGIVRVVLGRNLEQAWESLVVLVDARPYALGDLHVVLVTTSQSPTCRIVRLDRMAVATYVLVDQHDRNVLPVLGELVESFLNSGILGLAVDDKVVLLRLRSFGDMLWRMSVFMALLIVHAQAATYSDTS